MICVLDFYQCTSPRGIPLKQAVEWTTSSAAAMTISPGTGETYFVKSIGILVDDEADLGASNMTVTSNTQTFGGVESGTLTCTSVDEIIQAFAPGTAAEVGCRIKGHIVFDVPIKLDDSGSETLVIDYTGGGGIAGGQINIVAKGWYIDEADF